MAQAISDGVVQSSPLDQHISTSDRYDCVPPLPAIRNCSQPFPLSSKCKSLANSGIPSEPRLASDMSSEQITKGGEKGGGGL